jgi:dynein heavy chain, axonemal
MSEQLKDAVCWSCVKVHMAVNDIAERYYTELKRRYYITPKSYLDLVSMYSVLLERRRTHLTEAQDRLTNGLSKLHETNTTVDVMKAELGVAPALTHH